MFFHYEQCLLKDGPNNGVLPELHLAYETWGTLNADRTNAILLHTGLSASSHAHSHDVKKGGPGEGGQHGGGSGGGFCRTSQVYAA